MFPEKEDLALVSHDEIACVLETPLHTASSSKLSHVLKLTENLLEFLLEFEAQFKIIVINVDFWSKITSIRSFFAKIFS